METGTLEKKIAKLPDELKVKVEEYVDALVDAKINVDVSKDSVESSKHNPKLKRKFGSLKGFITYMADDFDAPLDEFKEYM